MRDTRSQWDKVQRLRRAVVELRAAWHDIAPKARVMLGGMQITLYGSVEDSAFDITGSEYLVSTFDPLLPLKTSAILTTQDPA